MTKEARPLIQDGVEARVQRRVDFPSLRRITTDARLERVIIIP